MRQTSDLSGRKRERERDLSEQLLGDSRLRDNLSDAQAGPLLDWGLGRVSWLAEYTAVLPDEDALPLIDQRFAAIRTIIKLVNEIMGTLEQGQEELAIVPERVDDDMTLRLFKTLRWLENQRLSPERLAAMRAFNAARPYTDPDAAFQKLMTVITPSGEHT